MPKQKDDTEARAQLAAITGLDLDAPALDMPERPAHTTEQRQPVLAPEGVDPHSMPVTDIEFDPALLDGFHDLAGQRKQASDHVFGFYRDPRGRNKDRHSLLHSRIGKFIEQVRSSRRTGTPYVKDTVRRSGDQRDLLALLAGHGITSIDDLTTLLGGEE